MAKPDFIFSVHMCAISEFISVMRMLAEQAEKYVALALKEADEQGAVKEHEHEEEAYDQNAPLQLGRLSILGRLKLLA